MSYRSLREFMTRLERQGRLVRVPEGDDAPALAVQPLAAPVQGTLF